MIRKTDTPKTVDQAIDLLNSMLDADPKATNALFATWFECNERLRDHPTIQIDCDPPERCRVGLLGVINGIFGIDDSAYGYICMRVSIKGIIKFERMDYPGNPAKPVLVK